MAPVTRILLPSVTWLGGALPTDIAVAAVPPTGIMDAEVLPTGILPTADVLSEVLPTPTPTKTLPNLLLSTLIPSTATPSTKEWWEVDTPHNYFLVYGLLGALFAGLFGIMFVDMYRKYRTGELKETGKSLVDGLMFLFFKLPGLLFRRDTWKPVVDRFRSKESKAAKNTIEVIDPRFVNSRSVIERLSTTGPTLAPEKAKTVEAVEAVEKTTTVEIVKTTTVEVCPRATMVDIPSTITTVGSNTKEDEAAPKSEGPDEDKDKDKAS